MYQAFLDQPGSAYRIEVYVMKGYLKEKLHLDFWPRSVEAYFIAA